MFIKLMIDNSPSLMQIPQTCASDCTQTLMAAYLCEVSIISVSVDAPYTDSSADYLHRWCRGLQLLLQQLPLRRDCLRVLLELQ